MPVRKLPGVLSFNRGHIVTDAEMFNDLGGELTPVEVIRHGIRGTQNVNDGKGNASQEKIKKPKKAEENQESAQRGVREISNIQVTETAKLDPNAEALIVKFGVCMIDMAEGMTACVAADRNLGEKMREMVKNFIEKAKTSEGLQEVARRYARNILNGRWLWRNRTLAKSIQMTVKQEGKAIATFANAKDISLYHFEEYQKAELEVAAALALQMQGKNLDGLEIEARLIMPMSGNIEVFPSQNYLENKPTGFARPLYKIGHPPRQKGDENRDIVVVGYAALRDQKIWNAIRTIDTWYDTEDKVEFPIAIEPLGASLGQQQFYRKGKLSSFELFKRLDEIDPDTKEGMFCIAALDRGGVYSESDKDDKEKQNKKPEVAANAGDTDGELDL